MSPPSEPLQAVGGRVWPGQPSQGMPPLEAGAALWPRPACLRGQSLLWASPAPQALPVWESGPCVPLSSA